MLVAAANRLLTDEGVGAVTARRVAQAVALSHQIVHYYFKSMDDLVIAVIEYGLVFVDVEPFWQFIAVGVVIIFSVLIDQFQRQFGGARQDE